MCFIFYLLWFRLRKNAREGKRRRDVCSKSKSLHLLYVYWHFLEISLFWVNLFSIFHPFTLSCNSLWCLDRKRKVEF